MKPFPDTDRYDCPRPPIRYRVPTEARDAIEALDRLGFDSVRECAEAILTHEDWMERWDVESWPSSARPLSAWRRATLERAS